MASTDNRGKFSDLDSSPESIGDFLALNGRKAAIGGGVLAALVLGFWFWERTQATKVQRAEQAYFTAVQSIATGNVPLAQSDLKKMANRYAGTAAGIQGRIALAQILFDQGKHADGIAELAKVDEGHARKARFGASIHFLKAGGLEDLQRYGEAAQEYQKAADATDFPADKAQFRAHAARALTAAGKAVEARTIWGELAKDPASPISGEARIRLGELSAQAVPKS